MTEARTFAMGGSSRIGLLLATLLALATGVLVFAALRGSGDEPLVRNSSGGAETTVVTAKQDIPARTEITAGMLQLTKVPASALLAGAFSDVSLVEGRVARIPIYAGEQLVQEKLASVRSDLGLSYIVPRGMRAMGVKVDKVISPGGLTRPGDRVDVIAVVDVQYKDLITEREFTETRAFTIAQNVQVLAVEQKLERQLAPAAGTTPAAQSGEPSPVDQPEPEPEGTVVTLALAPEATQQVLLAETKGKIRLVVRAPGDDDVVETQDSTFLSLADPTFQQLIIEALRR